MSRHGPSGLGVADRVTSSDEDRDAVSLRFERDGGGESALANSGLTADEHDGTATLHRRSQPFGDGSGLLLPFEQPRRHLLIRPLRDTELRCQTDTGGGSRAEAYGPALKGGGYRRSDARGRA